jgi:8-oxo-dGTP pyrophosphatase MutT (NUDIX family)
LATERPLVRESARVLVIDGRDHVLLFQALVPGGTRKLWVPPGGGLEDGESYEEAAVRELAEEIGLDGAKLECCIWHRNVVVQWGEGFVDSRERWFVARLDGIELDGHINPDEVERDLTLGYRWWSLEEIAAATDEVFVPRRLAVLLAPLLRREYPAEPVEIGL